MSDTRNAQPVAMALQPDFVNTLGVTRRFMALEYADKLPLFISHQYECFR